jgi:glutamate-ammonia-ligase adenylyltransferase
MAISQALLAHGKEKAQKLLPDVKISDPNLALIGLSDFAARCFAKDPRLLEWLDQPTEIAARDIPDITDKSKLAQLSESEFFSLLRACRNQYWLKVAYLDLIEGNDIQDSIAYISKLAEKLIDTAYQWAYEQVAQLNGRPLDKEGNDMPMLVLGMGKLGGGELNYSSDIDLIFTYPYHVETQGGRRSVEAQVFFTKVAQKTIAALNQVTPDGQVFRVDMRLRPFGDSGPLVMSFNAMEEYYQEHGRDWERYAMLKARLLGDKTAYHDEFYNLMRPFVYRRYIDFSVIESLRKMKALIAQDVRRKGLTNNIKLGAGGIREAEFVVQALQMIRGGREPRLQTQSLLSALTVLTELGDISPESRAMLSQSYLFLRRVEQYLQQFDDKQTQTLPDNEIDKLRLCSLLNIEHYDACLSLIDDYMVKVHDEFKAMIGDEGECLDADDARFELVWAKPSQDTLDNIPELLTFADGWLQPIVDFKTVSGGKKLGVRGRDVLDKLMPLLLARLAKDKANSAVLKRVFDVISKIISRTAYLELLLENPGALQQLIKLCHHSKWIAEHLARYPILLDELIDPAQLYRPLPLSAYKQEIRQYFLRIDPEDLEAQMEALRQFKQTHQLRIAAADATGVLSIMKVSDHLTALAEAIIEHCVQLAWNQTHVRFGYPPGADDEHTGFAVIGYGKAGGIELGYDSDLDLVFVHNCDGQGFTNGDKQIDARQFYLKLAQRLLHLFNTRTSSGILYELDTRLRPEGASGLLAINIETFSEYQHQQAWTWEHQALVRARILVGDEVMTTRFNQIRHEVLSLARDETQLKTDVAQMRQKMRSHLNQETASEFDLKQGVGGMADIEFLAQYLVLQFAKLHPNIMTYSDNVRIFAAAQQLGILTKEQETALVDAYCAYRELYHVQSLKQDSKLVSKAEVQSHIEAVNSIWQRFLPSLD